MSVGATAELYVLLISSHREAFSHILAYFDELQNRDVRKKLFSLNCLKRIDVSRPEIIQIQVRSWYMESFPRELFWTYLNLLIFFHC